MSAFSTIPSPSDAYIIFGSSHMQLPLLLHSQREHVCQLCAPEEKRFSTANRLKSHLRQVHAAAAAIGSVTRGAPRPKGADDDQSISISREIAFDGQETTVVEVISMPVSRHIERHALSSCAHRLTQASRIC